MRSSRASELLRLFFQPLQLHLELADLLEQLSLLSLRLVATDEQVAGAIQQLLLPLAHLDRVDRVVGGNLLERLATTDRLHGDPGLELGAVGASLAQLLRRRLRQRWEPLSGAVPRLRG